MLTALDSYNRIVVAFETSREDGPFRCPECEEPVLLKAGEIRNPHFAHKVERDCGYVSDESDIHYDCKVNIYRSLRLNTKVTDCMVEYKIAGRRADIFAKIDNYMVAIEIQHSDTTRQEIQHKLEDYSHNGVHCLYILPSAIPSGTLQAVEWKRYIHAMYLQNLYYWSPGRFMQDGNIVEDNARVRMIHMAKYRNYPEPGFWTEKDWIQPRPVIDYGRSISICNFVPLRRYHDELRSRYLGITDALLWHHQLNDWWNQDSFRAFPTVIDRAA